MIMNRNWIGSLRAGFLFFAIAGTASCVDDQYDLDKNVDMTVTVGGDLTIPCSNTEVITLEKILDIEEGSCVQPDENGDYVLSEGNSPGVTGVDIDGVHVSPGEIVTDASQTSLSFAFSDALPDGTVTGEVDERNTFKVDKRDVTRDIVELGEARVNMPLEIRMHFQGNAGTLYLKKGFALVFPDYMTPSAADTRLEAKGSRLEFKEDTPVNAGGELLLKAAVTAIDFQAAKRQGMGLTERGRLYMDGEIQAVGTSYVHTSEFAAGTGRIALTLHTAVEAGGMDIERAQAIVDPEIDISMEAVKITDLPDFLKDDEVNVNLTDPKIFLKVTNPTPAGIELSALLKPVKDGAVQADKCVKIGGKTPVLIPAGAEDYVVCIHRLAETAGIKADAFVTEPDLNNLLERIPDEVRMEEIEAAAVQEFVEITPGSSYRVQTHCRFESPLQFNEGTVIVYTEKLDGWSADIGKYAIAEARVSIKATNGIPMGMTLTAEPVDAAGRKLQGVDAEVAGEIPAGVKGGETTAELTVTLKSQSEEAFHRLDGLNCRIRARTSGSTAGSVLNTGQTLKLDEIRIRIKGGVTIDMN